ncbi:hypothetical protein B0H11DRAFT_1906435 [Mycena galericulata]|nr:hypothetical protein B0H11DRAFT_1906435 [Mycena galericulata]
MDTKFKTPTCSRCKRKKMRCEGQRPCAVCTAANAECVYHEAFKVELRKGAACLPCRRKKKKCNGQRPCDTCIAGRSKKILCEYSAVDPEKQDSYTTRAETAIAPTDVFSPHSEGNPLDILDKSPSNESSETLVASGSSSGSPISLNGPVDRLKPPQNMDDIDVIQSPSPFTVSELPESEWASYVGIARLVRTADPSFDSTERRDDVAFPEDLRTDPALVPITDDSHLNLSINSPSPFFSSHLNKDELSEAYGPMPTRAFAINLPSSRQVFLRHRIQVGLSVSDAVLAAISSGSETDLIHPILLHACQLTGLMLARHRQLSTWLPLPGESEAEAEQRRLCLASIQLNDLVPCPVAFLQSSNLLAMYFVNKGDIIGSRQIFANANKIALDYNLDADVLEPPLPPEPMDVAFKLAPTTIKAEVQAALSQLVYMDLAYGILWNLPKILDPRLYTCFKTLITTPNFRAEINFVRAKSVFLLSEARRLAAEWCQSGLEKPAATQWQKEYWEVMELLSAHRSLLSLTLTKLAFCSELHMVILSMKACTIFTLTAIAELVALFSAEQPELLRKKHDLMVEIISISTAFSEEDCAFLDPLLAACWTATIATLDGCSMRGPREVVESMHDVPAMANLIRERCKTLQRVMPFALGV